MADNYATSNPPRCIAQCITGPSVWLYESIDVVGDVDATDYFDNGSDLGMKVGDRVIVVDTTTPLVTDCWVSAVTAGGAATVTQDA